MGLGEGRDAIGIKLPRIDLKHSHKCSMTIWNMKARVPPTPAGPPSMQRMGWEARYQGDDGKHFVAGAMVIIKNTSTCTKNGGQKQTKISNPKDRSRVIALPAFRPVSGFIFYRFTLYTIFRGDTSRSGAEALEEPRKGVEIISSSSLARCWCWMVWFCWNKKKRWFDRSVRKGALWKRFASRPKAVPVWALNILKHLIKFCSAGVLSRRVRTWDLRTIGNGRVGFIEHRDY